jgi:hypothetical protein
VGLLQKITGLENVRESTNVDFGGKNDTHLTIPSKAKLQDRLDGEVRNSVESMPKKNSRNPISFSIVTQSVDLSLDQREGGQLMTHTLDE